MRPLTPMTARRLLRSTLALAVVLLGGAREAWGQGAAQVPPPGLSLAEAREGIIAATKRWDAARLAGDAAVLTDALLPEFYAVMNPWNPEARVSRTDFLARVMALPAGTSLKRFDSTVLTVARTLKGFETVVLEKLEILGRSPDGSDLRQYALWVTRDGWRQVNGEWKGIYSIAVGAQGWNSPSRPPFAEW